MLKIYLYRYSTMRFLLSIICCTLTIFFPGFIDAQTLEVKDASGAIVLVFENDQLKEVVSNKIIYTVKGNIIFEGASDKQQDIELLVKAENIFSKKKEGKVLNASQREVLFSVRNGSFFYRDSSTYFDRWMMAHYRKEETGSIALFLHASDTLVCRIASPDVSTGKLVAVFYYFTKKFEWEEEMKKIAATELQPAIMTTKGQASSVKGTSGTIRKLWNTGQDEFEWDGEVLKRRWNSFDYEEWTFDGVTLKRLWYPGQEEMEWDGEILRRKWYSSEDEFEWDGSILRRRWGPASEGYVIQGNIIKPAFGSNMEREWEIDGNIPIPLIALVVFGLLRK